MNLGTYVSKGPLVGGVWYRGFFSSTTNDALIVLLGLKLLLRFGYGYDIAISDLTPATGGAHEIHLGMKFACPQRSSSAQFLALLSGYQETTLLHPSTETCN